MAQQGKRAILKLIIIGDSGVGKTSLMNRFVGKPFDQTNIKPTIGSAFLTKEVVINDTIVTIQIWDTAGQERFQSIGSTFYRGADACLLVYDLTNERSFNQLNIWRDEFLNLGNPNNPQNYPFVVVGNKVDLDSERRVTFAKAAHWCKTKGQREMPLFETSAKNAVMVDEAFLEVVTMALQRQQNTDPAELVIPDKITISHKPSPPPPKSSCC